MIECEDLREIVRKFKSKELHGFCTLALIRFAGATDSSQCLADSLVVDILAEVAGDQRGQISYVGDLRGKKGKCIPADKLRAIIPLSVKEAMIDGWLAARWEAQTSNVAEKVEAHWILGARKKWGPAECALATQLILVTGADDKGAVAVASSDVRGGASTTA